MSAKHSISFTGIAPSDVREIEDVRFLNGQIRGKEQKERFPIIFVQLLQYPCQSCQAKGRGLLEKSLGNQIV